MKEHRAIIENTVPLLDLAPRLKRPLALWNPLDYVKLLYWAFFFPQAIRWYVDKYGKPEYRGIKENNKIREILRNDPVQRRLVFQAVITLIAALVIVIIGVSELGGDRSWAFALSGLTFSLLFGIMIAVANVLVVDMEIAVARGIVGYVAIGLAIVVAACLVIIVGGSVAVFLPASVAIGITIGVAGGVAVIVIFIATAGVMGGVALGIVFVEVFSVTFGAAISVIIGIVVCAVFDTAIGGAGSIVTIAAIIIVSFRILDYLFLLLLRNLVSLSGKRKHPWQPSRMAFLELPGLRKQLQTWLKQDWDTGLHNANQLLAYTMQFFPVVKTINAVLEESSAELLLSRASALADRPYDWELIRYGSTSLDGQIWQHIFDGLFTFSHLRTWIKRWYISDDPRLDRLARAACAGFWFWHEQRADSAADAFAVVQGLPHGTELYGIARSIALGGKVTDVVTIAAWGQLVYWLDTLPPTVLRRGTLEALRILRSVAGEVRAVFSSETPINRTTAISCANSALTLLIDNGETFCQQPEWPIIKDIAKKWRNILNKAGGIIGEEVLR